LRLRVIFPCAPFAIANDADMQTLRDRFIQSTVPTTEAAKRQAYRQRVVSPASQKPAGSWDDIPYDNAARSIWLTAQQLDRTLLMAKAYRVEPDEKAARPRSSRLG